jgi:ABC-type tungstate transport system, periplasmic component
MEGILFTTQKALYLLLTGDSELWSIVMLSFSVSLKAIIMTTPPALLVAYSLVNGHFPGIRIILAVFNSLLSVPTVVIGLFLYVMLTRQGPFGDLRLLFTQTAM